ncbi:MAG TPA: DUF3488 and transglutaminase-like domain-containing protein [Mariprofundaceae bacterium]|nr:DUF3488 and transglutaminase-like domain-containing protein [Mariprofundaceae bacterium]
MSIARQYPARLILAERLTLAVLLSGVASLALSDFVSPVYWSMVVLISIVRLWRGTEFSLRELYASLIGWAGFLWVGLELFMGRAWIVAFTDFLLILSLAVVIEEATPRNHLHRMLVGFFLILGAAVLTDSVLYVLPLATFMWFVWRAAQCLYGMQLPGGDLPLSHWKHDLRVMIAMASVTGLLFMVLPRFDFHSYLKPVQPRMQTSGFSSKVQLGDFARNLDPTVVMRIEPIDGDIERFRKSMLGRYWRGTALNRYTGNGWEKSTEKWVQQRQAGRDVSFSSQSDGVRLALYREASDHAYIFTPNGVGKVMQLPAAVQAGDQGSLRFQSPPSRRMRILMQMADGKSGRPFLRPPLAEESSLRRIPQAVKNWAAATIGGAQRPSVKIDRLLTELKGWIYDLEARVDANRPVTSFMAIKRGHCELYATTLALAARTEGIPARVINGYSGGEWNEVGGFYLIRQQHAHSWVEAWVDGRWQRYDPTPSSRWQLSAIRFPALDEVWESVKLSWYRYVLEFQDSDRGQAIQSLLSLMKRYAWWFVLVSIAIAAVIILKKSSFRLPRWSWASGSFSLIDRWLIRRGVKRGLSQSLRHLPLPQGVVEREWQIFVLNWEKQAYGRGQKWSRGDLRRHLRALS